MARAIVTEEAVADVAQELADAGEEPSIIRVQALIGGGSFSTVKRFLDTWKAARQVPAAPVQAPTEVLDRAAEFGRMLWQHASSLAAQEVSQVREEARRQVEHARLAEAEAEQVIARLEAEVEEQASQLAGVQCQREEARAAQEQAQVAVQVAVARLEEQAQRLGDLQRQLDAQASELTLARAELLAHARLQGEVEALRHQLAERAADTAIPKPSTARRSKSGDAV